MDGLICFRKWGGVFEGKRREVKTSHEAARHIGGIRRSQTNWPVTGEEENGLR